MRHLTITKSRANTSEGLSEQYKQLEALLSQWAALGSRGLSPEAAGLQPLIDGNARFVVSLVRQYQRPETSPESLVGAAHGALINVLNQYVHCPEKLGKVLPFALRNAMIVAIQAPAGGDL